MQFDFFAACPKGIEALLTQELGDLGAEQVRETVAGASFNANLKTAYRICLWSRLANKILLPLAQFPVDSAEDLYRGASGIPWQQHLEINSTLWIEFGGTNDVLRNSQFSAQKVKDAIVDRLRDQHGNRPSIEKETPDLIVNARLKKGQVTINLDLVGESLHRRGYRADTVKAPLKENLAAALLLRSQWPAIAADGGTLIDPMCGSGSLLIEAALMAADVAPGLGRVDWAQKHFAFERWKQHQPDLWLALVAEARERAENGRARLQNLFFGYDDDVLAVRATERNLERCGLSQWIKVRRKGLEEFTRPTHTDLKPGLVITNPPYGERLGEQQSLEPLYARLGTILKTDFVGWQAAVFTGNPQLGKCMGLRSNKKYKLFNGAIPAELLLFSVESEFFVAAEPKSTLNERESVPSTFPDIAQPLSAGAQMVANRLRKNFKQLKTWREQQGITCYRLYDADMPEYAAAIDVYGDSFHVQEYAAPKSIDAEMANQRFRDLLHAVVTAFELTPEKISVKQRKRNRGTEQYEALTGDPFVDMFQVREGQAKLWVNLHAYLDSGLFLDHRPLRRKIFETSNGKRVLNLFCYTASVTVHAILGGAASSVSVDMSNTYLQWARKNFQSNDVDERKHQLIQADCITWLNECRQPFDIIVLDPPSFSNSKRMQDVLDIQRDHAALIKRCMELLAPQGQLYFSNNLRSFKLDEQALIKYAIEDFSKDSIDKDFERNPKIHRCWIVKQK